jgi:alpha-L-fucosidase
LCEVRQRHQAAVPAIPARFTHDRFGMFVHWGLYALPARHESVMNLECIRASDYEKYARHFEPDLYGPHAWAHAAKQAGMRYVG